MGTKLINITKLSDKIDFGVPYCNIYIFNDGGSGYIRINETTKLDIEKVKKAEDLKIRTVEWNLSSIGNGVSILLSTEKLDINDLSITLLSRLYSELQKKQNKKKIVYINASSSTTVIAGSNEVISLTPPKGKIWRVLRVAIYTNAPSAATTGTHRIQVYPSFAFDWMDVQYSAPYTDPISWVHGIGYGTTYPSPLQEMVKLLKDTPCTNDVPLLINYTNSTDVDQTNSRNMYFIIEETDEAI